MKKGFTLVELLIVIIIIGILATMALPQYQRMVNRARWTEVIQLATAIKSAENLYYAENGGNYTPAGATLASNILTTLQLPAVTNRASRFSIQVPNIIYGYSTNASPNDDVAAGPANSFQINLLTNATSYNGNAPSNW